MKPWPRCCTRSGAAGRLQRPSRWARWYLARRHGHRAVAPHDPSRNRRTPGRRHRTGRRSGGMPTGARPGGGRRTLSATDGTLIRDLKRLLDPGTADPMSPLLWTSKSTRNLADALGELGHDLSHQTVGRILVEMGYSLQANRKTEEGKDHPDRDSQFGHINRLVRSFQRRGRPVVSVDTKKKEILGNYKNPGREWEPAGRPRRVKSKDFPDKELGKGALRGLRPDGRRGLGQRGDQSRHGRIRGRVGEAVVAPHGASGLSWGDGPADHGRLGREQWAPQSIMEGLPSRAGRRDGLEDRGLSLPTGDEQVEPNRAQDVLPHHRELAGRPLLSRAVVVNLIGSTRTKTGLLVRAELDTNRYEQGIKVTDDEMQSVRLERDKFHGDWNYRIEPHPR